jgi:hypothetical protein
MINLCLLFRSYTTTSISVSVGGKVATRQKSAKLTHLHINVCQHEIKIGFSDSSLFCVFISNFFTKIFQK